MVFLAVAVTGKKQEKGSKPSVTLELMWEKEFPEGISDYGNVYFDKERGGLFCPSIVITGGGEDCKAVYFLDSTGSIVYEKQLEQWSVARVSRNGQYIGIMKPEKYDGEFHYGPVEIINRKGKVVNRVASVYGPYFWVSPSGDEIISWDPWSEREQTYYYHSAEGIEKASFSRSKWRDKGLRTGKIYDFDSRPALKWSRDEGYIRIFPWVLSYGAPASFATSHDKHFVAFRSGEQIILYDFQGHLLDKGQLSDSRNHRPTFSPNDRYLVVATVKAVDFFEISTEGDLKHLWSYKESQSGDQTNVGVAPDVDDEGNVVVLVSESGEGKIRMFDRQGNVVSEHRLVEYSGKALLRISKDGRSLAYVPLKYKGSKVSVFKVAPTGNEK